MKFTKEFEVEILDGNDTNKHKRTKLIKFINKLKKTKKELKLECKAYQDKVATLETELYKIALDYQKLLDQKAAEEQNNIVETLKGQFLEQGSIVLEIKHGVKHDTIEIRNVTNNVGLMGTNNDIQNEECDVQ